MLRCALKYYSPALLKQMNTTASESTVVMDDGLSQKVLRALNAGNAILLLIAQGAPLAQSLDAVVAAITELDAEHAAAILLPDEHGQALQLAASQSLPPAYRPAIDKHDADAAAGERHRDLADGAQAFINNLQMFAFWQHFSEQAQQHGLHPVAVAAIGPCSHGPVGFLVTYSRNSAAAHAPSPQPPVDFAALASLAVQREAERTESVKVAAALHASQEKLNRMELAIEGSATGVWDRNIPTGEIHYSPGWKANLGYVESEVGNRIEDSFERVHPEDLAAIRATMQAHFEGKSELYVVEHRIRCKDGSYKWISSRGKIVSRDADGNPQRMIGTTMDITSMRTLSEQLRQSVDLITCLTNEIPGMVFQYKLMRDGSSFFSYVSEGVREIYELTPDDVVRNASLIDDLIQPEDLPVKSAAFLASVASLTPWRAEFRVNLPRQGVCWRHIDAQPRRLPDGSTLWHGVITDVTERKRADIELTALATIDFLTQLPNRRCFMAGLEEELARTRRTPAMSTAVLMCDLDHFKKINDEFGHATGDMVLKAFGSVLSGELRKNDIVGRIGGEEFGVALSGAGTAEARIFAERVQRKMAETVLMEGGNTILITVSIGISVMDPKDPSADASLSRSDMALYRAKEGGRNRIEIAS